MACRILVLLDYSRGDKPAEIAAKHGIAISSLYLWLHKLLVEGLHSLKPKWKGGRPAKLTQTQKKVLCQLIEAGPGVCRFDNLRGRCSELFPIAT